MAGIHINSDVDSAILIGNHNVMRAQFKQKYFCGTAITIRASNKGVISSIASLSRQETTRV